MQWDKTDEEKLLAQSAADYFRQKLSVHELRRMRDTSDRLGFDRARWKEMAELGWTGILVPEEFGGLNFGFRGLGLVLEAAGRHLSVSPLLGTVACASSMLVAHGTDAQKAKFLPAIAGGDMIIALALEEGGRHGGTIKSELKRAGKGFQLNGRKTTVLDAAVADHILVLAQGPQAGLSLVMLPAQSRGIQREYIRLLDGRPAEHLIFEGVEVSHDQVIGEESQAGLAYEDLKRAGAVGLSAEILGSALAAFEMTLAYLKERKQFGVAIGSFQALQHRMAQLYSELEVSRACVERALGSLDDNAHDRGFYASLAKGKLSELFPKLAAEAIQLHGGIGMTDEHTIGFYLKRSRVAAELFGNAAYHRDLYAKSLQY